MYNADYMKINEAGIVYNVADRKGIEFADIFYLRRLNISLIIVP